MVSSKNQEVSYPEKVIVVCPNCSQKLRVPVNLGKLRVRCPKCKHDWFWSSNTNISNQIERIKEKIARARQLHLAENKAYPEFYKNTRILTFQPPLSASEIDLWETKYNVFLPEEYRSFLEQIGNGGEFYDEILSLKRWAVGVDLDDKDQELKTPSQPCLLLEKYESDEMWEQWLIENIGEDWAEKYYQSLWSPHLGMITIAAEQCGALTYLVLNGPLRGRICWFLDYFSAPTFESAATFLDWFETLLDKDLNRLESRNH
ncbi:SMI1/KNR4 family protein [Crocosphaera sp.]|uniref:SMI1/KNR4 family protein n=1 Tax=Crocosphaera sp. TaxID=2729996 RepID=UPI002616A023|nr:SMI1/KNR4 family protein [Crocosphaera sp.]MDJ0582460.1 SMI1/KNR4 family protein [Crocosphaera sp.]